MTPENLLGSFGPIFFGYTLIPKVLTISLLLPLDVGGRDIEECVLTIYEFLKCLYIQQGLVSLCI